MYINRLFKDVIYLFCCQDYLKIFLENYRFIKNLGMMHIVGGVGGSCYSRQKFLTKKLSSCLPTLDGCFFLKYGFKSYSFTPVDWKSNCPEAVTSNHKIKYWASLDLSFLIKSIMWDVYYYVLYTLLVETIPHVSDD